MSAGDSTDGLHREIRCRQACLGVLTQLTGKGVVSWVSTDLGVFDVTGSGFTVVELAPGVDHDDVVAKTAAPLTRSRVPASV